MTTWESGRESNLLDEIINGRKTIEGRLNRGKFALYVPGDIINLRRDIRNEQGELRDGEPNAVRVRVVAVRHYQSFKELITTEGYQKVIPTAKNEHEATDVYDRYYTAEEQQKCGVLAIEITTIPADTL